MKTEKIEYTKLHELRPFNSQRSNAILSFMSNIGELKSLMPKLGLTDEDKIAIEFRLNEIKKNTIKAEIDIWDTYCGYDDLCNWRFYSFTPKGFSIWKKSLYDYFTPVRPITQLVIAFDIWDDIVSQKEWESWFENVSVRNIVQETGKLCRLLGVDIITDGFLRGRRILKPGECYLFYDYNVPINPKKFISRKAWLKFAEEKDAIRGIKCDRKGEI